MCKCGVGTIYYCYKNVSMVDIKNPQFSMNSGIDLWFGESTLSVWQEKNKFGIQRDIKPLTSPGQRIGGVKPICRRYQAILKKFRVLISSILAFNLLHFWKCRIKETVANHAFERKIKTNFAMKEDFFVVGDTTNIL